MNVLCCPYCKALLTVRIGLHIESPADGVLEESIENISMSTRSYNRLHHAQIKTIQQLIGNSERDLLRIKNLGKKSMAELKDIVHARGLKLRDEQ